MGPRDAVRKVKTYHKHCGEIEKGWGGVMWPGKRRRGRPLYKERLHDDRREKGGTVGSHHLIYFILARRRHEG